MKYGVIPAALLALLLGLALWSAEAAERAVSPWRASLAQASDAAAREDWDAAAALLDQTRAEWDAAHARFHLVSDHGALDAADALFAAAEAFAAERDRAELRAALAELSARLAVVAERQRLSLRNIL